MSAIKDFYIATGLVVLMILRPFAPGEWFGSVAVAGILVTWMDTINKIWKANTPCCYGGQKKRYANVFIVLGLVGLALFVLMIVNLAINLKWLNKPVVLDELTLAALLVCLEQNRIIEMVNSYIQKGFKR